MKRIIGILGITFIAMFMSFNTNTKDSFNSDFDLSDIINVKIANAECNMTLAQQQEDCDYFCEGHPNDSCNIVFICDDGSGWQIICDYMTEEYI
ncbi:hypothetical protein J1D01_16350 [Seonamhaeicola sp. NFXS20]